jgi:hypothetical protein
VIAQEDTDAYREWFNKEWITDKPLYATRLSALHRLLFAIITTFSLQINNEDEYESKYDLLSSSFTLSR